MSATTCQPAGTPCQKSLNAFNSLPTYTWFKYVFTYRHRMHTNTNTRTHTHTCTHTYTHTHTHTRTHTHTHTLTHMAQSCAQFTSHIRRIHVYIYTMYVSKYQRAMNVWIYQRAICVSTHQRAYSRANTRLWSMFVSTHMSSSSSDRVTSHIPSIQIHLYRWSIDR